MINEQTIRQYWSIFKKPGEIVEIRILGTGGKNWSGYFTDVESAISAIRPYDGCGIYATINPAKSACYSRSQRDRIEQRPKATTSDTDIDCRTTLLVDIDPKRPADTNASDAEVQAARKVAGAVCKFLSEEGFEPPVVAFSANGFHLYYRVFLANTPEIATLVKNFLYALDMMFSDDAVSIDTSVFNASRIAKLIGTTSNKGTNTAERPQRLSEFRYVPVDYRTTDIAYIRKVADLLPKPEQPSRFNNYSTERFDLDGFIAQHGIEVVKRTAFSQGEKLILKECPFDPNHKAPDSAIFRLNSGAIGFRCLHNSCSHYGWRDVRLHFDPQAYDAHFREQHTQKRMYYGQQAEQAPPEPVKEDERGKKWLSMGDIIWTDPSKLISIPSGIVELDRRIMGFSLGDVTIMSGTSGSGKTTLLDHFILNAVHRGYKVAAWSGELQGFRFQSWLDQMAAGKAHVVPKQGFDDLYYAPRQIAERINGWLDGRFWLYNNDYGDGWANLFSDIKEIVKTQGVQFILLDNLMALDLEDAPGASSNERETRFIKDLKRFAKEANIHALIVCHPRKEQSFQLLRKESIAGTANLTNLCDNLLISHRVGNDFERRAKDFFGPNVVQELMAYDVVIEVAKNRSMGVVDALIGLYYEKETRRIKNEVAENIIYGWDDAPAIYNNNEFDDLPL